MTAVAERIEPQPVAGPERRPSRSRYIPNTSVLRLIVLTVLLVSGLSAYAARVDSPRVVASYPAPDAAASWVQTASPAQIGWFRSAPVLAAAPESATLWIDARDTYRIWINGRVAATNRAAARAGAQAAGNAVDVRSLFTAGANVVAVQVSGLGEQSAALWMRLRVQLADHTTRELGTDQGGWLATSDAARSGSTLGAQPAFLNPGFGTTGWRAPVPMGSVRVINVPIPQPVIAAPATPGDLTVLSVSGFDGVYTLRLQAPTELRDAWMRVAGTGALSVSVNGQVVTNRPPPQYVSPNSHRPAPLWLVHLGAALHSGANELVFRVTGTQNTAVGMDAFVRTNTGWSEIGIGSQDWAVRTAGRSASVGPLDVARAEATWPHGFISTPLPVANSPVPWRAIGFGALGGLLGALALLAFGRRRVTAPAEVDPGQLVIGRLVLVLAPAAAVIAAALAIGRWITLAPGFAYRPATVLLAIAAALAAPVGLGVAALVRRSGYYDRPGADTPSFGPVSTAGMMVRRLGVLTPSRAAVVVLAAVSTVAQGWRLGRQPIWQDEATSIAVARAIRAHGLPRLDSGLYYFKAELYHVLLAGVLSFTDSTTALRAISLVWFAATVLAFGLLLMPVLTDRAGLVVIATTIFVLLPAELAWARDIRMYQQMQFFVVVFLALFIRALRDGRRRDIILSAVAMLAMYLSHEESFVLLPAVPLAAMLAYRTVWVNRRTYLAAFGPVAVIIVAQYLASHLHPVDFGDDLSNRPYVGWDPHQADFYYQRIFFGPVQQASMAVLSTLAVVGIIAAIRHRHTTQLLAGLTLLTTVAAASLIFTAKVDRYSFAAIPLLVALGVIGGDRLAQAVMGWCVDRPQAHRERTGGTPVAGAVAARPAWVRWPTAVTVAVLCVATMATLVVSPVGFGLWAADASSAPNPLTHLDYRPTVTYLRAHIQPGDQVITLSPPVMTKLYLGRAPDRVIQTGRNKLLYLVLRDGRAVDTLLGVPVLLTGAQLRTYLQAHQRVWLVSDTGSYVQGVPPDMRAQVGADFHVVYQDATTTLSLWDVG